MTTTPLPRAVLIGTSKFVRARYVTPSGMQTTEKRTLAGCIGEASKDNELLTPEHYAWTPDGRKGTLHAFVPLNTGDDAQVAAVVELEDGSFEEFKLSEIRAEVAQPAAGLADEMAGWRLLREGETVLATDEYKSVMYGWKAFSNKDANIIGEKWRRASHCPIRRRRNS